MDSRKTAPTDQPGVPNHIFSAEGYSETRDALVWVLLSAPNFKFGLTYADVLSGLEHGFESVRRKLQEAERLAQLDRSRNLMRSAIQKLEAGQLREGKLMLQEAQELFTTLRRIGGRKPSRQELGDTEHGANELDE